MATTNYGLPTFDGDQADQPIQFKSTITQGFQKIDQVMKQNEEAAAPVSAIETEIESIQSMLQAMSTRLESVVAKLSPMGVLTAPPAWSADPDFGSSQLLPISSNGIYDQYYLYGTLDSGTIGKVLFHINGDRYGIGAGSKQLWMLAVRQESSTYNNIQQCIYIECIIKVVNNVTQIQLNTNLNQYSGSFYYIMGNVLLSLPLNQIIT